MSTLTGRTIADSYTELLKTAASGGVTSSLTVVEDGDATASALQISTNEVRSTGSLVVQGQTSIANLSASGDISTNTNLSVGGNTTLGNDESLDVLEVNSRLASNLIPTIDDSKDLGSSSLEWKDLYVDGTANIDSLVADTADINGGSVDGTTIGASSASTGRFTQVNLEAQGQLRLEDTAGGQYVGFRAPGTVSSSYTLTLPQAAGTAGFALVSDGAGNLIWQNPYGGGATTIISAGDSSVAVLDTGVGQVSVATDGVTRGVFDSTGLSVFGTLSATGVFSASSTIELGHASDTTLARGSAGRLTVEGVNVPTISSTDTLTNKTLTTPVISQISNTGTLTLPTSTDTLVGRDTTDTLTNKTLTSPTLTSPTLTSPTLTTPILGTPSSGTLTNCTGLPISGIVASTTLAIGVGTIELGHASDTTLARGAAGRLTVEGVDVPTISSTDTLTNKTLTSPVISSISNTGTLTLPTSTDTLVGRATTDTLTNKTLTSPSMTSPSMTSPSITSGVLTTQAGTVGAPTIIPSGDPDTGIFFPSADTIAFSGGGAEAMRIDSSGRVGIGTTTLANKLEIVGSLGRGAPVTKTADFTLADTENWVIVNKGSTCTVTLPAASLWTGRELTIKVITAHTVVSDSSNVIPRIGGAAGTAILPATDGAWATLVSDGTDWEIMCGP